MTEKVKTEIVVKSKPWYRSKTILAGIGIIILSAYDSASIQFGLPPVPESLHSWISTSLGGIAIYGRVKGKDTINK